MSVSNLHHVPDRIPPHNLEAEMAVLGSAMVDHEIMGEISEIVRADDFYAHVHESIFAAIYDLYDRGRPIDKITLTEELRSRGQLDKVGGVSYLSALMDTVQTAASAKYYATIVREKAVLRGLIHAGTQITQIGFESEEDVSGALDNSEQIVFRIGDRQLKGEFEPVKALMQKAFDQLDELFSKKGGRTGITSGFPDIDRRTTGFQPTNFIIIAARPGMGKTSFALNAAVAAAKEALERGNGEPVAFFSLEMSKDELVQRLISSDARISMHDMRSGRIHGPQWDKLQSAMEHLSELPLYLDDSAGLTVSELRSRCRRLKSRVGLSAVFLDYLQLVQPATLQRSANRNEELSLICRTLKVTSKELGVPIIALAQLNRGVESRNDKRPMLSDLRDSGSLEQEADLVAFLYRDDYYNEASLDPGVVEFIIAKHRNGPTGTEKLRWEKDYTLFQPYADAARYPQP